MEKRTKRTQTNIGEILLNHKLVVAASCSIKTMFLLCVNVKGRMLLKYTHMQPLS